MVKPAKLVDLKQSLWKTSLPYPLFSCKVNIDNSQSVNCHQVSQGSFFVRHQNQQWNFPLELWPQQGCRSRERRRPHQHGDGPRGIILQEEMLGPPILNYDLSSSSSLRI